MVLENKHSTTWMQSSRINAFLGSGDNVKFHFQFAFFLRPFSWEANNNCVFRRERGKGFDNAKCFFMNGTASWYHSPDHWYIIYDIHIIYFDNAKCFFLNGTASWYHSLCQWTMDMLISAKINSCLLWLICYFLETKKSFCYIIRYGPDLHCSPIDCGPPQVRTSFNSPPTPLPFQSC